MIHRISKILFPLIIMVTLFSFWAGFALLIVNQIFHKDLPGYVIGRLCIWELIALIIAALITRLMIKKWGNIEIKEIDGKKMITIHPKYGIYFFIYFAIAILVGIWQFWVFSQMF